MNTRLTVIICTHNPKAESLRETLGALRAQTVPAAEWDLLLIDNGSENPFETEIDLTWHPTVRIVREERLGIAHARHRAFREAVLNHAGTILFVDDDNVLDPDYIARGAEIAAAWPQLGAWGGQLLPRYAVSPPAWSKNYLEYLAVYPLTADLWCNSVKSYSMVPPTAGCFLRAAVWLRYLDLIAQDPRRLTLTRSEDMDLALTAIDLGLGLGRFRSLRLTHIIPASRLTAEYFTQLLESTAIGMGTMKYIRYGNIPCGENGTLVDRALLRWRAARLPEPLRSFIRAEIRGRATARQIVLAWEAGKTGHSATGALHPVGADA